MSVLMRSTGHKGASMKQTSSRDTAAYRHGVAAFKGEHNSDCPFPYGTEEYNDWWQGYDEALKDRLTVALEQERNEQA